MKITLCGSAKFESLFHQLNERLTLGGHVVYGLSVYPSQKNGDKDWYSHTQKRILDQIHLMKIDNSEAVVVINKDGYIGESTAKEVRYAIDIGKQVFYLEGLPNYSALLPIERRVMDENQRASASVL